MKSFDDLLDESVKFGDSQRTCFEKGFVAGQQSQQAHIDELEKRIGEALDLLQGKQVGEVYKAMRILMGEK